MLQGNLAAAFTLEHARVAGLRKGDVYAMVERGEIERVGRGIYVRHGEIDPSLLTLAAASTVRENATLCLTSALVHHDLIDAIPFGTNIALPRGTRHPTGLLHVSWHSFDPTTFHIGRELVDADGNLKIAIYSAERTIIDCFRLMHQEGSDIAHEALRRWLRKRGNAPSSLLQTAASFPKSLPRIRHALEVLL